MRRGFTLIELTVVITILLLLAFVTLALLRPTDEGRIREGSRIAQAAFAGAVDRAAHSRGRIGVRLIVDPQDANLATGLQYVRPVEVQRYGRIEVRRIGTEAREVHGFGTDWIALRSGGFIGDVFRVQVPAARGPWYVGYNLRMGAAAGEEIFETTAPLNDEILWPSPVAISRDSANASLAIEPLAELLPNHTPISLPSGIVIDIPRSSSLLTQYRDVMFSPRGSVTGPMAALGPIHLMLRDIRDVTEGIDPANVNVEHREDMLLTIFPQTGHVQTYPVDPTDADNDGTSDDLFRFAKLGSAAGN